MSFEARCPACGSPVVFGVANSLATVCPACQSVVGRADGTLETYGKVADLAQTDSPLQIGLRGKYRGVPFEITGRTQYRHTAGGVWDEWYAAFRDGQRWGWIAEAQGRVYLTFPQDELPKGTELPRLSDLAVDAEVLLPKFGAMRVAEIGTGSVLSAEGELPSVPKPGEPIHFADLSGKGRRFATLDESDGHPVLYAGGVVTFEQLGIAESVANREKELRTVAAEQVNCPNCGGALELRAPDETLRVGCQFCGSLLNCNDGKLQFLKKLKQKAKPRIPLGTVGTVPGDLLGAGHTEPVEFTVIGFVQRKVVYEGTAYRWQEYLLYRPRTPYCWLISSNRHWSFGRPIEAGEVNAGLMGARAEGRSFRIYERGRPRVDAVLGEFYWKVTVGETVESTDYVSPPYQLSREVSLHGNRDEPEPDADDSNDRDEHLDNVVAIITNAVERRDSGREVNYTLAKYVEPAKIEKWFGVDDLPRPSSVAPNQPFPHKKVYTTFLLLLVAAFMMKVFVSAFSARHTVFDETFSLEKSRGASFVTKTIDLKGGRNLQVQVLNTSWVYVDGSLYNEASKKTVRTFGLPDGRTVYLSSVSGGKYTLKMSASWENSATSPSPRFRVRVRQGVPHISHFFMLLGILLLPLALVAILHFAHETQRWKDSDYSPYSSE